MTSGRMHRVREWWPLLPLLLLLAATYWLNLQVQPLPPPADGSRRHDPDFIISKFAATSLNEQGSPRFLIAADKMVHYPDNDSTYLDEPQLNSLYPGQPSIYTSARKGEISGKGDEVFLRDGVKLIRAADAVQGEMIFTTEYLHVVPDRNLADTDRPVTLTDARNVIQAVGMQLDYKARNIKLLAQVRSQHEIPIH